MRVTIVGDSFTKFYKDTYLEKICVENKFTVLDQIGFPGHSQYKIYKHFLQQLNLHPDVMIVVHTEHSRLYNSHYPISYFNSYNVLRTSSENLLLDRNINTDLEKSAKNYYEHLYDDEFAKYTQNAIIKDMQQICMEKKIKLINFPAFENLYLNKFYGLWFTSLEGLVGLSRHDNPDWNPNLNDTRKNHFTPRGHAILAEQTNIHIKNYLKNEDNFHIVTLYHDYFL